MAIGAQFTADFSAWTASVNAAETQLQGLRGTAETVSPALERQAEAAGRQIAQLGRDVTDLASKYIAAYAEEEAATQSLVTALQAQGGATQQTITDYQKMAGEFQKTTGFADDAVTSAQAVFTTIGKVGPDQMRPALEAATNLATFMKTDLNTAATMIAKAFGTGGDSLGKLKALLGDTVPKGAEMSDVLQALNDKFGGQAAANMETTNGKLLALKNQFGDIQEQVGGLLVKGLTPLLNAFTSLPEPIQTMIATVGIVGTALAPIAIAIGSIVTAVTPLIAALVGAGGLSAALAGAGAALAAIAAPVAIAVAAIAAVYLAFKNWDAIKEIVAGVYNVVKTYLVDKFNALLSYIKAPIDAVTGFFRSMAEKVALHSYVPDMINTVAGQFGRLNSVMTQPAQEAAAATTAALKAASDAWINSPFNRMTQNAMTILTDSGGVARDAYGRPVAGQGEINALPRSLGHQNIQIAVYGSVLSTKQELAKLVDDALISAYRQGGNRLPT
jgi:hypothetical protein